ncbi:hypothetical protein F9C07_11300 [Aspergillus flavus]|uniref:Uncharacterized protein n=1 Tax=Aspergillus flavus (strain ATCC 200026 / FGSC A1120 / IAM 13836 / NRRL 3357 / JCM 12722 / SRRC 167) TaxID=332952 RepID=A0A7U2MSU3_ASPFN|nr:uncharacterized protein G4B84_000133 [Aspergillus flavus NRRL3357]KAF7630589.1 hypothetical protein AFLA_011210 [Aspergillus flavus NRRL3357]QMW24888.1 hypothetical protein G4B84_000133 [Aspergillus flavus NRRL3357]QRD89208.1 hypothetical protein F9C07_11300 [Aspergillus flavus]
MHFHKITLGATLAALLSLTTALPTTSYSFPLTTRDDTQCPTGKSFYRCYKNNFRGCCSVDPCDLDDGCPDNDTPTCTPGKIYQPKMQTYLLPSSDPISTPNLNVSKSATAEWDQTMTFSVPQGAKTCTLNWGVPAERNFKAGNNALVRVWQGDQVEGESIGAADFTNWPGVEGPHLHTVGTVQCAEEIVLRSRLDKESEVFLEQGAETGWYIDYKC